MVVITSTLTKFIYGFWVTNIVIQQKQTENIHLGSIIIYKIFLSVLTQGEPHKIGPDSLETPCMANNVLF